MTPRDQTQSETDEYGISSLVFRARRPFHPQRLWDLFVHDSQAARILRSKGYVWLATRPMVAGYWSHAGQVLSCQPDGHWWAATPRTEWPDDPELVSELDALWEAPFGDRRQELVVIGESLDHSRLQCLLQECLLTDEELATGEEAWQDLPDPFAGWDDALDASADPSLDHARAEV